MFVGVGLHAAAQEQLQVFEMAHMVTNYCSRMLAVATKAMAWNKELDELNPNAAEK